MDTSIPASRTWNLRINARLDGAVVALITHTVTVYRVADTLVAALVDGQQASIERAHYLLMWAKEDGELVQVAGTDEAPAPVQAATISKKAASLLHANLGRIGYANKAHYEVASAAVHRDLISLTELTEAEVETVWAHACKVIGYSVPCARLAGRGMAA